MLHLKPFPLFLPTVLAVLLAPGATLLFAGPPSAGDGSAHDRKGLAGLATAVRPGFLMGAHTKSSQLESAAVGRILGENYNLVSVGIYQKHVASVEASAAGKDYPEGKVIQPQRGTPWMEMPEYQKLYPTFQKLKPTWNPPGKGKE